MKSFGRGKEQRDYTQDGREGPLQQQQQQQRRMKLGSYLWDRISLSDGLKTTPPQSLRQAVVGRRDGINKTVEV